jgi:asparagine synthase (glutamine-hydrolysing)
MQLPEEFLLVTDRFSMAHGVEARVPFLDHELVELAFTVPAAIRTRLGDPKYLAREVVRPFLPPALLGASKRGFTLPLSHWTRADLKPLIQEVLNPAALARQGLLSPKAWSCVVEPHLSGKRELSQQVWTLLMFQLWHQSLCGTPRIAAEATCIV